MGGAARADSLLSIVIDEYPGGELAKRAQIEMDVQITVVTRRDLAERDFLAAEGLMESDMVEAVKAFYNVFKQYPDMDIAQKSLYAAAWNTDNALQKNRAAMRLYEELCDKYPQSPYCAESAAKRLAAAKDTLEARRLKREKDKEEQAGAAEVSGTDGGGALDDLSVEDDGDDDGIGGIDINDNVNADSDIGTNKSGASNSDTGKTNGDKQE
jgi:outer membrane protein assembly factor BamD (BamD/ComL family)